MEGPAQIVVPVQGESIKVVRDWVEDVLEKWGQDAYVAKVVVSELVTNVLRHTGSATATVRVVQADRGTVVEVFDSCDVLPVAEPADPLSEGGRGLAMMGALVKEWGAQPLGGGGKAVWALCATRRSDVSPVQPGEIRREISGSNGLPGSEK
ncbi:ATP-binding protein [Actinomadura sp. 7K507]|uniref:ATP-binding protein n=1 Tax=Actinomadura sp. 7K507 TaxID=2530365 RepID=UPI0014051202|nr:ATP-binding protein [Actinomadura sp. 7K507]